MAMRRVWILLILSDGIEGTIFLNWVKASFSSWKFPFPQDANGPFYELREGRASCIQPASLP